MNGEDSSSSSSEEEKEASSAPPVNGLSLKPGWSPAPPSSTPPPDRKAEDDDEEEEGSRLPTIFFSHTVEPKKVRSQTGRARRSVASTFTCFTCVSGEDQHGEEHHAEVQ